MMSFESGPSLRFVRSSQPSSSSFASFNGSAVKIPLSAFGGDDCKCWLAFTCIASFPSSRKVQFFFCCPPSEQASKQKSAHESVNYSPEVLGRPHAGGGAGAGAGRGRGDNYAFASLPLGFPEGEGSIRRAFIIFAIKRSRQDPKTHTHSSTFCLMRQSRTALFYLAPESWKETAAAADVADVAARDWIRLLAGST